MGKYLPIIVTAECGSLTRAGLILGYTQPSLGYIINNIEDELGVKLFYRDQRGVTLTGAGVQLLEIMKKIEDMDDLLHQTARASAGGLLRVGIFPSVASQWLPAILREFYEKHPDALVKLSHQFYYLNGEIGVKDHSLDCAFFTGILSARYRAMPSSTSAAPHRQSNTMRRIFMPFDPFCTSARPAEWPGRRWE